MALIGLGTLILLALDVAGAPESRFVSMVGMLPLGAFVVVRVRQRR